MWGLGLLLRFEVVVVQFQNRFDRIKGFQLKNQQILVLTALKGGCGGSELSL